MGRQWWSDRRGGHGPVENPRVLIERAREGVAERSKSLLDDRLRKVKG